MDTVPFVDLKAQYHNIKSEMDSAVLGVLESGRFVLGEQVDAFEREFASFSNARYAIGLNSGTSALHLALMAADIGPNAEVITMPFTFVASVASIIYVGARPVFVDVDPRSYTMAVDQIENAITPRTKAIMPVHFYGQSVDMDPLMEIARRNNLLVIEDAAQAHGAEYKGQRVGSIGDMGCFSFYPSKNLGAYGEGGMVVTSNSDFAETIRMLRDWGQDEKYHHSLKGYNYRLEELQAAILRVKLRHLDDWTQARRSHAACYNRLLADSAIETPQEMPYTKHVYHIYAIRASQREELQQALHKEGIQTGIHYPIPVHMQPGYADLGHEVGQFPASEDAAEQALSLPMYPELTIVQLGRVASAINEYNTAKLGAV